MAEMFTVKDFFKRFPTDDACLDYLMKTRFGEKLDCPKCQKHGRFTRARKIKAYQCAWCGHHIHPMVGTPFEDSRVPLQSWFYAMYLFTTSRHGVSAKELERQLGVTYKTAWRMGHQIRSYLAKLNNSGGPLKGHVEIDETRIGAKGTIHATPEKTFIFGMVQREGNIIAKVVTNIKLNTLMPLIRSNVQQGTKVTTDGGSAYVYLWREGYDASRVNHMVGEYVRGDRHVNTIEGFWSIIKRSIAGTHIHVSTKHLPKYLSEFEYRFNMRRQPQAMFGRMLLSL